MDERSRTGGAGRIARRLGGRFSYANVMATIAVFVALGGSSYAAITVGTEQLRDDAVTSAKIGNGQVLSAHIGGDAVDGTKVQDGTLRATDLFTVNGFADVDVGSMNTGDCRAAVSNVAAAPTVAGIRVGDRVVLSPPADLPVGLLAQPVVQGVDDELTFHLCNFGPPTAASPTLLRFRFGAIR